MRIVGEIIEEMNVNVFQVDKYVSPFLKKFLVAACGALGVTGSSALLFSLSGSKVH